MGTILTVLIIIVCVLLAIAVLIQNSKGGGLVAGTGSVTQVAGVKASSEIEKITWGLAIALVVLCLISTTTISSPNQETTKSSVQEYIDENGTVAPPVNMQNLSSPSVQDVSPETEQE